MALDPQKTDSPQYREILVTDIDWVFDWGLKDAVTLREGDTVDTVTEPGWIVVTLQPSVPGGFPEIVRHQIAKIISERHQMRVLKVPVGRPSGPSAPTGSAPAVGAVSAAPPDAPAPLHSGVSPTVDTASLGGPWDPIGPESPTPPTPALRRRTRRPKTGGA